VKEADASICLSECQRRWIKKFDEMQNLDADLELAAPFLSVADSLDDPTGAGPILLVGKATDKDWRRKQFLSAAGSSTEERVGERRKATRDHLDYVRQRQFSAFWRFWKRLSNIGSPVIWTNLAKIGVLHGNPGHKYLTAQQELARITLRAEISEYRPVLVVITGDYAKSAVVLPVFGDRPCWKEHPDYEFCWIERTVSKPAVLWTDHPERKLRFRVQRWLDKARELAQPL
jgi:hypothetical protein